MSDHRWKIGCPPRQINDGCIEGYCPVTNLIGLHMGCCMAYTLTAHSATAAVTTCGAKILRIN